MTSISEHDSEEEWKCCYGEHGWVDLSRIQHGDGDLDHDSPVAVDTVRVDQVLEAGGVLVGSVVGWVSLGGWYLLQSGFDGRS